MAFLIHRDLKAVIDILKKNGHVSETDTRGDNEIIKDLLLVGILKRKHLMRVRNFGEKTWDELLNALGLQEGVREATEQKDVNPLW